MTTWHPYDPVLKNTPTAPANKPWRVRRWRVHWYWGYRIGPVFVADFRWYWRANLASFFWHHFAGYSCSTSRKNA